MCDESVTSERGRERNCWGGWLDLRVGRTSRDSPKSTRRSVDLFLTSGLGFCFRWREIALVGRFMAFFQILLTELARYDLTHEMVSLSFAIDTRRHGRTQSNENSAGQSREQ